MRTPDAAQAKIIEERNSPPLGSNSFATSASKSTGAGVLVSVVAVEEPGAGEQDALFGPPCWMPSDTFEEETLGVVIGVGVGAEEGVPAVSGGGIGLLDIGGF
jgi:hypothetical protein